MDQHEQQRERDKIIRQLQVLETQIASMGWDTYAEDLAEVRRNLATRWEQTRAFDEVHPRGPDGAFVPR